MLRREVQLAALVPRGSPREFLRCTEAYRGIPHVETFSCAQIDVQKARERELATLVEKRREVGLMNPMRDKVEGKNRGEEGTTPMTTACPEAGK